MDTQSQSPWPEPITAAAKRVLVVDDDRDIRELLVELLEGEGYQVSSAENGEQALLKARLHHPNLILLDLMMPVMSGWRFRAEQAREPSIAGVPVVVISAYANDLDVEAFIPKPFPIEDVLEAVHRFAA
ncbi:MAG TPA: response regulator [Anaeromyxobacteraceae bacterium]|nr:response regulator [Anaeromyxobacteraceae bacterium]